MGKKARLFGYLRDLSLDLVSRLLCCCSFDGCSCQRRWFRNWGAGLVLWGMTMLDPDRWGFSGIVFSGSTIATTSWMEGQAVLLTICHISLLSSGYLGCSDTSGHSLLKAIRSLPRCLRGDQIDSGAVYHYFVISRLAGTTKISGQVTGKITYSGIIRLYVHLSSK